MTYYPLVSMYPSKDLLDEVAATKKKIAQKKGGVLSLAALKLKMRALKSRRKSMRRKLREQGGYRTHPTEWSRK